MTRANLNFVYQNRGEAPRTLFYYHNGDQYPTGLRDSYNVLDFINKGIENKGLTAEMFKEWIAKNYTETKRVKKEMLNGMVIEYNKNTEIPAEAEDLGIGGQPKIYYTDGYITDYSYVFEKNEVAVWNWDESIFSGNLEKFKKWIIKQK